MTANLAAADLFVIFLVTVGPLKAAIVYASLTAQADKAFQRTVAIRTVITASIVLVLFVVAGEFLLEIFHVSLPALKIAGGLILLLFSLHMVMSEEEGGNHAPDKPALTTDIAIYPLAMPMMATPQGIVAVVTVIAIDGSFGNVVRVLVVLAVVMAINLATLLAADRIMRALGPAALKIIARVAGILLAALAVQLMLWALRDLGVLTAEVAAH